MEYDNQIKQEAQNNRMKHIERLVGEMDTAEANQVFMLVYRIYCRKLIGKED